MANDPSSKPTHLEPSELGTKEYWDNLYTTEITNHSHDPSDKGTVWFDDSDAETKVLEYLEDLTEEGSTTTDTTTTADAIDATLPPQLHKETTSFLDLGCGNGSLLFALRGEGWRGRCLGVDYSERSVALARQIAGSIDKEEGDGDDDEQNENENENENENGEGAASVGFEVWDVLRGPYDAVLLGGGGGWDVVHDKGTFDAVSLSEEEDGRGRRLCEGYKGRVMPLVRPGGVFLVTSCNWTEEELEGWFGEASAAVEGGRLVRVGKVHYPSFSFGGVKGQTISTVCYRRVL